MKKRLLLVEDTISLAALYKQQIETGDFAVDHAETGADARAFLKNERYDVILLDLGLPDIPGIDILREVRQAFPGTSVVIITANASIAMAVQAVREGAYDYLIKPVTKDRLVTTIKNAVERSALKQALTSKAPVKCEGGFCGFIGSSPAMQAVYDKINSVARSKASVFITGESGTGKELCAEAIHRSSGRSHGPFVAINCGAIPKDLMESEIFGHLKGSFTGAIADRDGAARMADGGTLFLDEICELDLALQTKLLRFLQTGLIQRVGAASTEKVDIRVICATNRSPMEEVEAKRFRQDLYFRLHVLPIHMPALRERGRDIVDIARHFLVQFSAEEGKSFERISADAEQVLLTNDWPGNVRELQNAVRQCVVLSDADELSAEMLLPVTGGTAAQPVARTVGAVGQGAVALEMDVEELRQAQSRRAGMELWQIEKEAIESTIAACQGSIPKAAKILGVSPSTIYRKREAWQDEAAG
jgi:DNA-binding NtrC family response regulator